MRGISACFSIVLLAAILVIAAPAAAQRPVTVGEHIQDTFETPHPYPASGASAAEMVWFDQITYPGATYIAPHFARFHLAPGDFVVVRSPDGTQKWIYEGLGKRDLGLTPEGFFAAHIKGDTAIIELHTAGRDNGHYGYKIDYYGRGYNDNDISALWDAGLGEKLNLPYPAATAESLCGADDSLEAKCYMVSEPDAYNTSTAVARLLLNGSAHCTGWLIGCDGHVMTNEHCIGSQSTANNIDFEFMAEGPDCATSCQSALACSGTIEASGGTLVAVDAPLDYAMVLADTSTATNTDLPATYGFMRLRASGPVNGERIYVPQHPAGWGKRIGLESTHAVDDPPGFAIISSVTEPACSAGGPAEVGYYADTQGGSSGSPVLGYSDNKIVALHHCRGNAACTSSGGDPNRGVPIDLIIADLGGLVPACAVCDPMAAPTSVTATPMGDNQVDLSWTASADGDGYNIYRSIGGCPAAAPELIASGVVGTSYSDTTVSGGTTYSYSVTAADSATGCESDPSNCDDALATGLCTRAPTFDGLVNADNAGTEQCSVDLSWNAATGHCGAAVVYNVYRDTVEDFTPGPGNLLDSCVSGTTFSDFSAMTAVEYFYKVQAEDDSGNGSGLCAGGNEGANDSELSAIATGPDTVQFEDDMEGGTGAWGTGAGPTDTGTTPWAVTSSDAHSGTQSWFVAEQPVVKDQHLATSGSVAIPAGPPVTLEFWHRYNTEATFDGGVLEISTDGGTNWTDILDGNGDRFLAGGYNSTLSTGFSNPLPGRDAWSGDNGTWELVQVDLSDFGGQSVHLRWRFGCDSSVTDVGWWVDDVRVFYGSACVNGDPIFFDGFESGDTTMWDSTVN